MRAIASFLAFTIAICGLGGVVAFMASEAYLDLRNNETNLNNTLLLGTLAPEGWAAAPGDRGQVDDKFVSPCLAAPLLRSASITGRGAMSYAPVGSESGGVQLLMVATKSRDARAIMDSVRRDTENDCQRGLSIGTVSSATVTSLGGTGADEAILVELTRNEAGKLVTFTEAVLRSGDVITLITYRNDPEPIIDGAGIGALASRVVGQVTNPPSEAVLEAAGALEQPSLMERASNAIRGRLSGPLSFDGRTSHYVGLAVAGALALLFYVLGAKLNAGREVPAPAAAPITLMPSHPTLENYSSKKSFASKQRRWIRQREPLSYSYSADDDLEEEEAEPEEAEEATPAADLPPVLDIPQRSIDEKLKILKEARLREPRPEPLTSSPVVPDVDWTEEISKADARPARPSAPPRPEPVTRKLLLQKLRSQNPGAN